MNLEEIKQRATEGKVSGFQDFVWAADTILQLVAEVEKRDQHILDCYNKIESLNDYADKNITSHVNTITKLTAANKILRDGSIKLWCAFNCELEGSHPACQVHKLISKSDEAMI